MNMGYTLRVSPFLKPEPNGQRVLTSLRDFEKFGD